MLGAELHHGVIPLDSGRVLDLVANGDFSFPVYAEDMMLHTHLGCQLASLNRFLGARLPQPTKYRNILTGKFFLNVTGHFRVS